MRNHGPCAVKAVPFLAMLALMSPASEAHAREFEEDHVLKVQLPAGVTRDQARGPDAGLRKALRALIAERIAALPPVAEGQRSDLVVLLVDDAGMPVAPDLEAAREARSSAAPAAPTPVPELAFTYDSPSSPWTAEELATLQADIAALYPVIRSVYGSPAFAITVNVEKVPGLAYVGMYVPWDNTLLLRGPGGVDVLCHEMIHAFRDDNVIRMSTFEEGMTRAAEVEVFNRLPSYGHWDLHHSHPYDARYEGLSRRAIAGLGGDFFDGFNPFLRYQLAGMAWAKPFIENPSFFAEFNQRLYDARATGAWPWETDFIEFAAAAQPTVEGIPFPIWYQQQPIFDRYPPAGYFLYQRAYDLTVYYFQRGYGGEHPVPLADVQWSIRDWTDATLSSGTSTTNQWGWFDNYNSMPLGYTGRMKVVATASSPNGPVEDVAFDRRACMGIFGFVLGADSGTLTLTPVSGSVGAETIAVSEGGFCAASLGEVAGAFRADFTGPSDLASTRIVTKDASPYLAVIRVGDTVPPVLDLPAALSVDATSPSGEWVHFSATATDDTDPRPAVACSPRAGSRFAIGTTAVNCTAMDVTGNAATGTFPVHVKGAAEQLADLIAAVAAINAKRGIIQSLDAKLENARKALEAARAGASTSACNVLEAFVSETRAQSGKLLAASDADRLIQASTRIRDVIGCP